MSGHASKPAGHFDCSHTVALLFPYLDHELDAGETEAVQTHLARCGPCADLFRFEGNVLRLCGERLARVQAPPDLRRRIGRICQCGETGG